MLKRFVKIPLDHIIFVLLLIYSLANPRSDISYFVGLIFAVLGWCLWLLARKQLGASFSVMPRATHLVTSGLYSKIRNPIYIFSTLAILGICLVIQNVYLYGLLVLIVLIQIVRAMKENKALEEKFGEEYNLYKSRTWF